MKALTMARGSVLLISLRGRLTSVLDPGTIPEELKALVRQRESSAILEMGAVAAVDCSGIGLLVTLYRGLREAGGSVKFLNLPTRPRILLETCGLLKVFQTFESEEDALTSLVGLAPPELYLERTRLHFGSSSKLAALAGPNRAATAHGPIRHGGDSGL